MSVRKERFVSPLGLSMCNLNYEGMMGASWNNKGKHTNVHWASRHGRASMLRATLRDNPIKLVQVGVEIKN